MLSSNHRVFVFSILLFSTTPPCARGEAAGATREALSPEEELRSFHLPAAFRIELVAAEPDVRDPVALAWDAGGRLWVAEMADYPEGTGGGRVRFLWDQDSAGRFRRSAVFAEGLPYPSSVLPHR